LRRLANTTPATNQHAQQSKPVAVQYACLRHPQPNADSLQRRRLRRIHRNSRPELMREIVRF
jgi:hypothetical protein